MGLTQILRGLSYKGYSAISVTKMFFAFGLFIIVFGIAPLYTNSSAMLRRHTRFVHRNLKFKHAFGIKSVLFLTRAFFIIATLRINLSNESYAKPAIKPIAISDKIFHQIVTVFISSHIHTLILTLCV